MRATSRTFTSTVAGPHERGVELGEALSAEVARTVDRYAALFSRRARGSFDLDRWGHAAWASIADVAPEASPAAPGVRTPLESAG